MLHLELRVNKPERVFGLIVRCRELDIFKILGIFWAFFGHFLGILWEIFGNYLVIDLFVKILVFVKLFLNEEGRRTKFKSLEVRESSSSHLIKYG